MNVMLEHSHWLAQGAEEELQTDDEEVESMGSEVCRGFDVLGLFRSGPSLETWSIGPIKAGSEAQALKRGHFGGFQGFRATFRMAGGDYERLSSCF